MPCAPPVTITTFSRRRLLIGYRSPLSKSEAVAECGLSTGNLISEVSVNGSYQGMTSVVPLALGMDPALAAGSCTRKLQTAAQAALLMIRFGTTEVMP